MRYRLGKLLIDPFRYVAGSAALATGIAVLLVASVLDWYWGVSTASLLHVQYLDDTLLTHLSVGVVNWLCLLVFFWPAAAWISSSRFRLLDLAGTTLLARWPAQASAYLLVPESVRQMFESTARNPRHMTTVTEQMLWIGTSLASILLLTFSLWLTWRAFAVSCNLRGPRAVMVFAVCTLGASLLSFFVNGWQMPADIPPR